MSNLIAVCGLGSITVGLVFSPRPDPLLISLGMLLLVSAILLGDS